MKLFLSAGEVSGDVHGAGLARELARRSPGIELVGWGSCKMAAAGVELLDDLVPLAAVGVTENLAAVRPAARALGRAESFLAAERPDAVVLIDYQGANMRLAAAARTLGLPTVYFISPQDWIWGWKNGPRRVARLTTLLLAVFEREAEVYRAAGANVVFVGHPLLDQIPAPERIAWLRQQVGLPASGPVLGLFPGSRAVEIDRLLEPMLDAAASLQASITGLKVILPVASPHFRERIAARVKGAVTVVEDVTGMEVLSCCTAALAASGTITLEAAICGVPTVATYRVSALTAFLARRLFGIRHVTLPNIVAGTEIIPELLQAEAHADRMAERLLPLLQDTPVRRAQLEGLATVRSRLGEPGATGRAAEAILAAIDHRHPKLAVS